MLAGNALAEAARGEAVRSGRTTTPVVLCGGRRLGGQWGAEGRWRRAHARRRRRGGGEEAEGAERGRDAGPAARSAAFPRRQRSPAPRRAPPLGRRAGRERAVGGAGGLPGRSPAPAAGARKSRPGLRRACCCGRRRAGLRRPRRRPLSPLGSEDAAGAVRMEQTEGEGGGGGRAVRPGLKGPRPPCLLPALRRGPGAGGDGRRWAVGPGRAAGAARRTRGPAAPRAAAPERPRVRGWGRALREDPGPALPSGPAVPPGSCQGGRRSLKVFSRDLGDNFGLRLLNQRQRAISAVGKDCSLSWCPFRTSCGW